jgi:hypothetical protein
MLKTINDLLLTRSLIKIKDNLAFKLRLLKYIANKTSKNKLKLTLNDFYKWVLLLYTFLPLIITSIILIKIKPLLSTAFIKSWNLKLKTSYINLITTFSTLTIILISLLKLIYNSLNIK